MCDSEDFFIEFSCEHFTFKFLYIQVLSFCVLDVNYVIKHAFIIYYDLSLDLVLARSYFVSQVKKCMTFIIFINA